MYIQYENIRLDDGNYGVRNFQKFMIDENGSRVGFVAPKESPFSGEIVTWIEKE